MKRISRWGVGPSFAVFSIVYGMTSIVLSRFLRPIFEISLVHYQYLLATGSVFVLVGLAFFAASVRAVTKAYKADELVTTGVFGFCRHPLYGSWIVFIVPGIALTVNSLLALTAPFFMYVILIFLVRKEEAYLVDRFGEEYFNYRKRIPCILPYGVFLRRK
ncbi:isoprenylcysteine carboxylmethyltransferase family protein [candidate division WOR-3 bacterium]|nr:isoprenylcysteine carboxylmethyltransferase family protein [candidate division WOR-3 bacterium]